MEHCVEFTKNLNFVKKKYEILKFRYDKKQLELFEIYIAYFIDSFWSVSLSKLPSLSRFNQVVWHIVQFLGVDILKAFK